jgi:hypothetical protein
MPGYIVLVARHGHLSSSVDGDTICAIRRQGLLVA